MNGASTDPRKRPPEGHTRLHAETAGAEATNFKMPPQAGVEGERGHKPKMVKANLASPVDGVCGKNRVVLRSLTKKRRLVWLA